MRVRFASAHPMRVASNGKGIVHSALKLCLSASHAGCIPA